MRVTIPNHDSVMIGMLCFEQNTCNTIGFISFLMILEARLSVTIGESVTIRKNLKKTIGFINISMILRVRYDSLIMTPVMIRICGVDDFGSL